MGEFRMPSLGADMEDGTLVEWLKHPGDPVRRGDIIAVVETQKGAIEVEVFEEGVVEALFVAEGEKAKVGAPLAMIAGTTATPPRPVERTEATREATGEPAPNVAVAPARLLPAVAPGLRASPAARKRAAGGGIDLNAIKGSGPEGAIVLADLDRDAATQARPTGKGALDLAEMRKAIAAAMAKSKREIPHYYLAEMADFTPALDYLEKRNAARPPEERILYAALLLKAVALAARKSPELNGFMTERGFEPSSPVHVGTAIAIKGGGLVAPAIHDVDQLDLDQLMARLRDLAERVREGRLRSSEMTDPTITVSSLGDRGCEVLQGIIYPPQVALVGFGSPRRRPWCVEDRIEPRDTITISLAADHRASDGHRGALFLRRIAELLQSPEAL